MTLPSRGFSLALSGSRMPPAVLDSASTRATSTRSPRGRIEFLVAVLVLVDLFTLERELGFVGGMGLVARPGGPRLEESGGNRSAVAAGLERAQHLAAQAVGAHWLLQEGEGPHLEGAPLELGLRAAGAEDRRHHRMHFRAAGD